MVYVLLTKKKIHAYSTWARAMKIHQRAQRMKVDHEFLASEVRKGDPFKRVAIAEPDWNAIWDGRGLAPGEIGGVS